MSRLEGLSAAQWQWYSGPNWVAYSPTLCTKLETAHKGKDKKAKKVKVDDERFVDLTMTVFIVYSSQFLVI